MIPAFKGPPASALPVRKTALAPRAKILPAAGGKPLPSLAARTQVPPWLAGATGALASVASAASGRPISQAAVAAGQSAGAFAGNSKSSKGLRVTSTRASGKIVQWSGRSGLVKPAEESQSALAAYGGDKSAKGLPFFADDVVPPGKTLTMGMEVTFFAYLEGDRLLAEKVMEYKPPFEEPEKKQRTTPTPTGQQSRGLLESALAGMNSPAAKGKTKGKFSGKTKGSSSWEDEWESGAESGWVYVEFDEYGSPIWPSASGKGGKKGKEGKGGKSWGKGGKNQAPKLKRKRVSQGDIPITGLIVEWKGKYGWILPSEEIDHPKANDKEGKIYVKAEDTSGDMEVGCQVNFHVYEDSSGLGAEECISC